MIARPFTRNDVMKRIFVSRNEAAIQWLATWFFGREQYVDTILEGVRVLKAGARGSDEELFVYPTATAAIVRGNVVYGNVPLHLAALAAEVWAIEFKGTAPRGAEYSLEDMYAAKAHISKYVVFTARMLDAADVLLAEGPWPGVHELHRAVEEENAGCYWK